MCLIILKMPLHLHDTIILCILLICGFTSGVTNEVNWTTSYPDTTSDMEENVTYTDVEEHISSTASKSTPSIIETTAKSTPSIIETTAKTTTQSESKDLFVDIIIPIVGAVLFILLLCIVFCFFMICRKKLKVNEARPIDECIQDVNEPAKVTNCQLNLNAVTGKHIYDNEKDEHNTLQKGTIDTRHDPTQDTTCQVSVKEQEKKSNVQKKNTSNFIYDSTGEVEKNVKDSVVYAVPNKNKGESEKRITNAACKSYEETEDSSQDNGLNYDITTQNTEEDKDRLRVNTSDMKEKNSHDRDNIPEFEIYELVSSPT